MALDDEQDLFAHAAAKEGGFAPLAERMRPRSLDEFIGQEHLVGPGRILRRVIESDRIPSMVFWGPPGVGKTTLAKIIANVTGSFFETVSATSSGVKDLRAVVDRARQRRNYERRSTILFVDEIHRFNKSQQDALLPHVEAGVCTLIGATTENPSFEVNAALLSRARVMPLQPVRIQALVGRLQAALEDKDRGLGNSGVQASERMLLSIARAADGDVRRSLNNLELAVDLMAPGATELSEDAVAAALGQKDLRYDRKGEEHYNVISAFIKSMRASDPDAAVYWLARMLEAGEDPMFVARRIVIFASEDVGNAEPQALVVANAAAQATHLIGLPEAVLPLTQATVMCALAPKSNTAIRSYFAARKRVREAGAEEVPLEVRNAVTKLMKETGYGQGYRYPHEFQSGVDPGHVSHLPPTLRQHLPERIFVHSGPHGWEAQAEASLAARRAAAATDGSAAETTPDQSAAAGPDHDKRDEPG